MSGVEKRLSGRFEERVNLLVHPISLLHYRVDPFF